MDVVRDTLTGSSSSDPDQPAGGDGDGSGSGGGDGDGGGDGPPLSAVLAPGSPLLRRLLLLLGDEAGFLVERRLHRLLAGIDSGDATLLRLDAVMTALGVRTQVHLDVLCRYFVR